MGCSREAVAELLLPAFLPFNLVKGGLNARQGDRQRDRKRGQRPQDQAAGRDDGVLGIVLQKKYQRDPPHGCRRIGQGAERAHCCDFPCVVLHRKSLLKKMYPQRGPDPGAVQARSPVHPGSPYPMTILKLAWRRLSISMSLAAVQAKEPLEMTFIIQPRTPVSLIVSISARETVSVTASAASGPRTRPPAPAFLPFNLVKGGLNAALTLALYRPAVRCIRGPLTR